MDDPPNPRHTGPKRSTRPAVLAAADAVGRSLDLLRRAELVAGATEGFVTLKPVVPF
jgi:hypothetical protein